MLNSHLIRDTISWPRVAFKVRNRVRRYSDVQKCKQTQKRFRQHVNPLSDHFKKLIAFPEWNKFHNSKLPIHLDIGCAHGEYLMQVAKANENELNFIGVEIRQTVIQQAQRIASQLNLTNLIFLHANINYQLHTILDNMPSKLSSISIFHPDPWFKRCHQKRRVITSEFVDTLAEYLDPTVTIYVQTDVLDLHKYMDNVFMESKRYVTSTMQNNAFSIASDREKYVVKEGGSIYRSQYNVIKAGNRFSYN